MVNLVYIENEIANHPRTQALTKRFSEATQISCNHYGEVFNPKAQNFRLQKQKPALILAKKCNQFVLPVPKGYGIGGKNNYYFSHMLNCVYDCRYCFLQGMFNSAHYVLFINYEDFETAIDKTLANHPDQPVWFFSGYDCDSLALEPVSKFIQHFLPFFAARPHAHLEIRSKSTQIRSLLKATPFPNAVIAYSFTPDDIASSLEHKTPSITKRISALQQLQQQGWKIGLRFDPLIYQDNYQSLYSELFEQVFSALDVAKIHSVSLGAFRLPKPFFKKMVRLYPDEPLFAGALSENNGMVSYQLTLEKEMLGFCTEQLHRYIEPEQFYPCT